MQDHFTRNLYNFAQVASPLAFSSCIPNNCSDDVDGGGGRHWRGCRRCRGWDCGLRGPGRYLMATRFARCLDLRGGKRVVAEFMPTKRQNRCKFGSFQ